MFIKNSSEEVASNFLKRVGTTLVLAPIVLWITMKGTPHQFAMSLSVVAALAMREFYKIVLPNTFERIVSLALGFFFLGLIQFSSLREAQCLGCICLLLFSFFILRCESEPKQAAVHSAMSLLGVIYISLLYFLIQLRQEHGARWVALALLMTWARDAGIYFVWLWLGGHRDYVFPQRGFKTLLTRAFKFYPSPKELSPNKAWGSTVASFPSTLVVFAIAKVLYFQNIPVLHVFCLSFLVSVMGQFGDLFESMIKRAFGVGDSGKLLPGHGGMLDRIDSLLFIAPTVYFYVYWLRVM